MIFSLLLPIKSSILMLKAPKLSQNCRPWIESEKKIWRWQISTKNAFFTKMWFAQNYILRYNLRYNEARVLKFGKCMQKKVQKVHRKQNFEPYWLVPIIQSCWQNRGVLYSHQNLHAFYSRSSNFCILINLPPPLDLYAPFLTVTLHFFIYWWYISSSPFDVSTFIMCK